MKIAGLIAAALALAAPMAHAGTLTFTVTDATDGTVSKAYTQFSDAAITNWIAAYQARCDQSLTSGTCSRTQVLAFIVGLTVNQWVQNTNDFNAAQAAAGGGKINIAP